jgi:hypothetical protein
LRARLGPGGRFVLFITKRNWLTRPLIGRWWRSNLYTAAEIRDAFDRAGFVECTFRSFPPVARLSPSGVAWSRPVTTSRLTLRDADGASGSLACAVSSSLSRSPPSCSRPPAPAPCAVATTRRRRAARTRPPSTR